MTWEVITTEYFQEWFEAQEDELQVRILAGLNLIEMIGPSLSRPHSDTIKGSKYANMKELRVQHEGNPYRVFYAFDPIRNAIVCCAANKKGLNEKKFYADMIKTADAEFQKHLEKLVVGK